MIMVPSVSRFCDSLIAWLQMRPGVCILFFFNDRATTEIYTLSLHDALPISIDVGHVQRFAHARQLDQRLRYLRDRKSTRLNSSHSQISYAVFCLKKKMTANLLMSHSRSFLA